MGTGNSGAFNFSVFKVFKNESVSSIATDKALFSSEKMPIFFLFLHENICCGYILEAPR